MGAIAGLVHAGARDVAPGEIDALAEAGAARAIDGVAQWRGGPAGLIRFRHATTPEALDERQPRPGGSGAVLCFDGRIDNRAALIARLGRVGAALGTRPDDELVTALFEAEGEAFLRYLAGDWALAIWQPAERRLLCARGPVGFRAFYYVADARRFAFATEPRTLLRGLALERRINEGLIAEQLAQRIVTPDESLWASIARLPQGAALSFCDGNLRCWQYDDAPYDDWSRVSEAEHVARFRELFDQALIATTRSNTPVLAQLSGGLDSSSVLCRATELQRAGRIERPIGAITARFPGEATDESAYSGLVEHKLGITAQVVSGKSFDLDEAARWVGDTLQPPLRPNTLNTLQGIFERAQADGVRVLLSGEGGDELLNGSHAHWVDELRRGRVDLILREALAREGVGPVAGVRDALYGALGPFVRRDLHTSLARRRPWAGAPFPDWLAPDWLRRVGLAERVANAPQAVRLAGLAAQNRYAVVEGRGLDMGIEGVAAYGEQLGVEYRHPLYDRRLVSFCLGAAGAVLFRGGVRRHLLREAMRGTLPEAIRIRRSKAVFNAQAIDGMTGFYRDRAITDLAPVRFGWVDGAKLRDIWDVYYRWRTAGGSEALPPAQFGALWGVASFDLWLTHAARI